jgi:hypothetical protein
MRYYILAKGDSIMTQRRVALVKDSIVENILIIDEENMESLKADIESQFGGELIDSTDWVDEDTETPTLQVGIGFSYVGGKFVKPEPTPNTITAEDIERSLAKFAADAARGENPDLNSLPEGATGPQEENN